MMGDIRGSVLLLDDEVIVAMDVAQALEEAGFAVEGPFHAAAPALAALGESRPDAAILDVNLGGNSTSFEVAEKLVSLDVPFAFLTGYDGHGSRVLETFPEVDRISKPVEMQGLIGWLHAATTR